jgi:polyisoprenoid-binding protein YceI
MKKLTSTVLALAFSIFLIAGEKKTYKVDTKVSSVEWMAEKVSGSHEGTISVKEGSIMFEDNMITGGSIMIDMNSIMVTDIKDEGTNAKLKGHLMSDDFFGVKGNPTASLKITSSKHVKGEQHVIMGDITIKGKTEKVEIPVTVKMEKGKVVVIGETKIDRTKFDIRYGSGQFFEGLGDKMIYDEFTVKFMVGAK